MTTYAHLNSPPLQLLAGQIQNWALGYGGQPEELLLRAAEAINDLREALAAERALNNSSATRIGDLAAENERLGTQVAQLKVELRHARKITTELGQEP